MRGIPRAVPDTVTFRSGVRLSDPGIIRDIVASTGFFSAAEIGIAAELADEALDKGPSAGYFFVFAEVGAEVAGYACFGPIPCTTARWDLYWIAVHDALRGRGLGRCIMEKAESAIRGMGGTRVYIDTSSRLQYEPTRGFYESCGYTIDAVQRDFYAPGDSKVIYIKTLQL